MGPILPQINVIGKQMGIPPDIMGLITSILPIMYVLAKPAVGFLADFFTSLRKVIFMAIIAMMTLCYAGFYLLPMPKEVAGIHHTLSLNASQILPCNSPENSDFRWISVQCSANCSNVVAQLEGNINSSGSDFCAHKAVPESLTGLCVLSCEEHSDLALDNPRVFWAFVLLMCLGTIAFNVINSLSDAVCFDVLEESQEMKYGQQRVWGTIGFGLTALIGGIAVDMATDGVVKSIGPAIIVMIIFSVVDLFTVTRLKLPKLSSESILKDVMKVLKRPGVVTFLIFATIAGIIDSFIIYYMFWHLEEVAAETGYEASIKLIEGCVVAAECLGGEILFFLISGKILKRIGFVHCLSLCFFTYSLRLVLISVIPNPWYLVPIELFMQGATYALCYTCIVAYASAIAPPGTSSTIQGLVAGMDDGLGFAIGSLIGGQMYKRLGGAVSFRVFAAGALVTCIAHIILRPATKSLPSDAREQYEIPPEQEKVGK
ncbi:major facilitator superfamily domain-containing protein 6 isoform X2 [Phlebotomus papatasi]|nr:major facilitator superfamily domain-containing protein 6 isoform X2 [Phlebotomus papatasi]